MIKQEIFTSNKKNGRIEIVCGPMFSGKTEALIERLSHANKLNLNTLAIKPQIDNRYAIHEIVSHNGTTIQAQVIAEPTELKNVIGKYDFIAIDEAQFFASELVEVCESLAENGAHVLLAGLDKDYLGRPFSPMPELLAIADSVTKLSASCSSCKEEANFTFRLGKETEQFMLGTSEQYTPLCRNCFNEKMKISV